MVGSMLGGTDESPGTVLTKTENVSKYIVEWLLF